MTKKIRVAAVSYLNTKPLLYGLAQHPVREEIEIVQDYPAKLPALLQSGEVDIALLPVASMAEIPDSRIVGGYGIAADGPVASVCLFSAVPVDGMEEVLLDFQSRTSVMLVQVLLRHYWKKAVRFLPASESYIEKIGGSTAGVIIGDRALENLSSFPVVYDLAEAWKAWTGLPFVFAAWVATKDLPVDFVARFDEANKLGSDAAGEVAAGIPYAHYDLRHYLTRNIRYLLGPRENEGLQKFLQLVKDL